MAAVLTFTIWVPWTGLVTLLTVGCYLSAFYFRVVEASVTGDDHPPDWPEFSSMIDDIIIPGCQMFVIYLLSLIPTFLMVWLGGLDLESDSGLPGFGEVIMILTFALYFPMAVLRLIHFGTYGAVLHHRVVPAIFRCLPGYLVAVGAVMLEMVVDSFISVTLGWIPILGIFIHWLGVIYMMIFSGRVTGLFYRQYRETLGW